MNPQSDLDLEEILRRVTSLADILQVSGVELLRGIDNDLSRALIAYAGERDNDLYND